MLQSGENYALLAKLWSHLVLTAGNINVEVACNRDEVLVSSVKFPELVRFIQDAHCCFAFSISLDEFVAKIVGVGPLIVLCLKETGKKLIRIAHWYKTFLTFIHINGIHVQIVLFRFIRGGLMDFFTSTTWSEPNSTFST